MGADKAGVSKAAGSKHSKQSRRFLWLYALAWSGGAVAYVPFLTILLPARVLDLAGDDAVSWLARLAFFGAIFASIGNIAFAWASDLTRGRLRWVVAGLVLSCSFLILSGRAETLLELIAVIAFWQLSLNMMLGPLAAWAGDNVPDAQKGELGGLLAVAPAFAAASATLVTIPGLASVDQRLWLVAGLTALCVIPVVLFGRPSKFPDLLHSRRIEKALDAKPVALWGPVTKMWMARLLVQVSEAALFTFLLVWLQSLSPGFGENDAAQILSVVLVVAIPAAMMIGRYADRRGQAFRPLWLSAGTAACGLLVMALAQSISWALAGYCIFGVSGAVFLSLHSAQTLRVLPKPETRGRDLGIFNLTNTVPVARDAWNNPRFGAKIRLLWPVRCTGHFGWPVGGLVAFNLFASNGRLILSNWRVTTTAFENVLIEGIRE